MPLLQPLESSPPLDFKQFPGDLSLTRAGAQTAAIAKECCANARNTRGAADQKRDFVGRGPTASMKYGMPLTQLREASVYDVAAQFEATVRTSCCPRMGCAPLMSCR